jgi:hypothetical protein
MRHLRRTAAIFLLSAILMAGGVGAEVWISGDHHVHSRFSVNWNRKVDPPTPIFDVHGAYPIPQNAQMAKQYGLAWMVTTDHGG